MRFFRWAGRRFENACRHSQGTKIEVILKYGRGLTLRIRDNGKGIDAQTALQGKAGHFGLRGMQERADRIGGRVTIAGKEGEGTELELTVPLHRSRKLFGQGTF